MTTERVPFRIIQMPCCGMLFCWVNSRMPNYCPECGERVYAKIKTDPSLILTTDTNATLKYKES